MATIDELRARHRPRRVEARILLDANVLDEHARLEQALQAALGDPSVATRAPELAEQLAALEARIDAGDETFTFEALGRQVWLSLIAEHPPTADQRAEGYDYDPTTFPAAAIAASCVSHQLDLDDAMWLANTLDLAEYAKVWQACLTANLGVADRPKSATATALRLMSERSSTTSHPEESLAASS